MVQYNKSYCCIQGVLAPRNIITPPVATPRMRCQQRSSNQSRSAKTTHMDHEAPVNTDLRSWVTATEVQEEEKSRTDHWSASGLEAGLWPHTGHTSSRVLPDKAGWKADRTLHFHYLAAARHIQYIIGQIHNVVVASIPPVFSSEGVIFTAKPPQTSNQYLDNCLPCCRNSKDVRCHSILITLKLTSDCT